MVPVSIKIRGLNGGHSGSDIHLQRANANKLMEEYFARRQKHFIFVLASINGGLMDNAITRECDAVVYVMKEDIEELMDLCSQLESIFNDEYSSSEDGICYSGWRSDMSIQRLWMKSLQTI